MSQAPTFAKPGGHENITQYAPISAHELALDPEIPEYTSKNK